MKKTIAVLFAIASAAAFAGMNDLIVSFSTPGPDKYADGNNCGSRITKKAVHRHENSLYQVFYWTDKNIIKAAVIEL